MGSPEDGPLGAYPIGAAPQELSKAACLLDVPDTGSGSCSRSRCGLSCPPALIFSRMLSTRVGAPHALTGKRFKYRVKRGCRARPPPSDGRAPNTARRTHNPAIVNSSHQKLGGVSFFSHIS
jgi:hypothetical protein